MQPGPFLLTLGLASLLLTAFSLPRRRDARRFFGFSSIEHSGLAAFAFGIGGAAAIFGGLLHMMLHTLIKSALFQALIRAAAARGSAAPGHYAFAHLRGLGGQKYLGWALAAAMFALTGMPPSGMFASEFIIVSQTIQRDPLLSLPLGLGMVLCAVPILRHLGPLLFDAPPQGQAGAGPGRDAGSSPCICCWPSLWLSPCRCCCFISSPASRRGCNDCLHARRMAGPRRKIRRPLDGCEPCLRAVPAGRGPRRALGGKRLSGACTIRARHWFQRLAHDMTGATATGATDTRPAIEQFRAPDGTAAWPDFPAPEGEGAHAVAVGPVHAAIIEPGHFRFTLRGEQVLKLQARFGYAHKGTLALMRGKSPRLAARFAARISGDATVAHSLALRPCRRGGTWRSRRRAAPCICAR